MFGKISYTKAQLKSSVPIHAKNAYRLWLCCTQPPHIAAIVPSVQLSPCAYRVRQSTSKKKELTSATAIMYCAMPRGSVQQMAKVGRQKLKDERKKCGILP